jgi:hypothetical protein
VARFDNKRGTVEQWINERKQAVKIKRLSCHQFRSDELRLWLSVIAYHRGQVIGRQFLRPRRMTRAKDSWQTDPGGCGRICIVAICAAQYSIPPHDGGGEPSTTG